MRLDAAEEPEIIVGRIADLGAQPRTRARVNRAFLPCRRGQAGEDVQHRPVSSRYVPDGFQIDAAEHVPKSSDKIRNRRLFRYTAGSVSLTVQPPSLPPLSRSAHLVAAVQKGSASTVAKLLIAGVENRAFACLKILCFWSPAELSIAITAPRSMCGPFTARGLLQVRTRAIKRTYSSL